MLSDFLTRYWFELSIITIQVIVGVIVVLNLIELNRVKKELLDLTQEIYKMKIKIKGHMLMDVEL